MYVTPSKLLIISSIVLGLFGTALVAQQSETIGTEVPNATVAAPELPVGESSAAPDEAGSDPEDGAAPEIASDLEQNVMEVVKATHGDWEVRCATDETDCFMYQLAMDDENNPVAEFSLVRLADAAGAAAGATVVSPLGTLLPAGVELQVDDGEPRRYPFTWCSQVGCFARFGVDQASIAAMKSGQIAKAVLVSVAAPDRPLLLEVSLRGFTAAFDSLEPVESAPN